MLRDFAGAAKAPSGLPQEPGKRTVKLSEDAVSLLTAAGEEAGHGTVMCLRTFGGTIVQAGGRNMVAANTPREEARWIAALEELVGYGLLVDRGFKSEVFEVTNNGYDAIDQIKKQHTENKSDNASAAPAD